MEDYKKKTMESYAKHPLHYQQYFQSLFDLERRTEFEQFASRFHKKDRILDLGCGTGDHAEYFASKGLDVTAVDLSPEMIHIAKSKKLDARVMDIEDLKFNSGTFHGIWSVTSLLHVPKIKIPGVIARMSEILKPDGLLYVCLKEGGGEGMIPDKHDQSTQRFFSYYMGEEFRELASPYFAEIPNSGIPDNIERGNTVVIQKLFVKK